MPCGVCDGPFFNPHFVIRDADSIRGLQASRRLARWTLEAMKRIGSDPPADYVAGYNEVRTATAGYLSMGGSPLTGAIYG